MGAVWEVLSKPITKAFSAKALLKQILLSFSMKTFFISLGILLSLLLLVNVCNAAEKNVAEFQPGQDADDITKNGEAVQGEKFRFLSHHNKPHYKKPFFQQIPHPIVKKPIPHHPILKKPLPKPHFPPFFPTHP
ncbi:uncharacterized protein LOC111009954 [Momordica charantia]|uniref:Uncharacterized protein LOC111009954 n=1 Tax=Momordica charantia TaxID=3673 RepID=A0A6J1CED0_MOMCH|nr:uncharacterized protein LOC111009954 [Momordica charantia]